MQNKVIIVDARGQLCPWPLILAKQALSQLASGATIEVWADDPLAELDLRALCARAGHGFVLIGQAPKPWLCVHITKA